MVSEILVNHKQLLLERVLALDPRCGEWRFEAYFHLNDLIKNACLLNGTSRLQFVACPLMVFCNQIQLILGGCLI